MRRYTGFEHALALEMRRRRARGAARLIFVLGTALLVGLCIAGLALVGVMSL